MKQKTLIMMAIAVSFGLVVGCQLVAILLTSQMSAGPKPEAQTVEIIVASKELIPGTKFTKDSLKDQVKRKKVNPAEVPQNAVQGEDELIDKQLVRTLRSDDFVSAGDLGTVNRYDPPPGKYLVTVKLPIEMVTPYIKPTSYVDVLGTGITRNGVVKGMVLLPRMLVMAVDLETIPEPDGTSGRMKLHVVTLAASREEAMLLRMAQSANVNMSFLLAADEAADSSNKGRDAVIKWINELGS